MDSTRRALDAVNTITSPRAHPRLHGLTTAMTPYAAQPDVADLLEQLQLTGAGRDA